MGSAEARAAIRRDGAAHRFGAGLTRSALPLRLRFNWAPMLLVVLMVPACGRCNVVLTVELGQAATSFLVHPATVAPGGCVALCVSVKGES